MASEYISIGKSKKQNIVDLLKAEELTVEEIEQKTYYSRNLIWVYINHLKKDGRVIDTGEIRNGFHVYTADVEKSKKQSIDHEILKKIIPKFVELGVDDIDFEEYEVERIKEIYGMVDSNA
ncbi:MAG: hypothetical protein GF364_07840 [Candidatus Lokiarchaeota archaeon]|nr:hypothetical protein [Candidatus Lokiarchaeota archaeon]